MSQRTSELTIASKLIQLRSRDLRARTRRKLLGTLAGPLAVGFLYLFGMRFVSLRHQLQPLFMLALTWSLAGLYFLYRKVWSRTMPEDAAPSTGLDFCRRELERQRDLLRRLLLWSFAPVLLAVCTLVLALVMVAMKGTGVVRNALPFLTLVILWIVGFSALRLRDQRSLQREIDELNGIEGEKHD